MLTNKRMSRQLYIAIILLTTTLIGCYGQQDVTFSQYTFDKLLINPAYAGSSKWVVGSLKNRTIFSDIEGMPQTNIFSFQGPIQTKNIGLGTKVIHDRVAVTNRLIATAMFSYHIGFGKGKLSFGLEGGVINNNYSYDNLERTIYDDPSLPVGRESAFLPDFTAGIYYQNEKFYIGGTAAHLVDSKRTVPNYEKNGIYSQAKSYNIMGGYYFELSRESVLEPGFLVKYVHGAPVQADISVLYTLIDKFSAGFSYRTFDAVIALVKIDITKNLKFQYSFDYTLSAFSSYFSGNHEVAISYGIELLPPPAKKVIHPRYYF